MLTRAWRITSGVYHPDLVNACDAVVGKVGYSTLAEVRQAGVPFGFVVRPDFREAEILADYVRRRLPHLEFSPDEFTGGDWLKRVDELLALPRSARPETNGADAVADYLLDHVGLG
jgi:hypothetical protein